MKARLKNILVPVDFNEPSIHSISYAMDIAHKINGTVHLLFVIETQGIINDFLQSGNELVRITDKAKEELNKLAESLDNPNNVQIATRIERGKVYKKILEISQELNARFVVLGENHPYDTDQVLGSTVYHVTLKSEAPVITVKRSYHQMAKRILVPLDLTKQTRKQLLSSLVYGMNYDTEIHLVSVKIANISMRRSLIQKKLRKADKTLRDNGVKGGYKLYDYSGNVPPYKRVLEYAEEIEADMILVLTHSEGFTYDNYIGAFAHHIINESPIPVLSLTAGAAVFGVEDFLKPILDPVGYLFKDESEIVKNQ